ncbi:DUF4332 domain-containing protein [Persicobacter diffluens]|uniref:DUF4332 domain-containing protein n=1 Tax=Persicobacter diffluens TaxID=981 RepID=A0AAN5AM35_9BACT|nr:hypothetical protein PEDI_45360 [Persicobacter diffluens]
MSNKITDIEGIGPAYSTKLAEVGIHTVEELLSKGASREGRNHLAQVTGLDEKRILKWVNMADLFRIKGIASQFAELLKASGVSTVKELQHRRADHLREKLMEVNAEKNLTKAIPSLSTVEDFIEQAKNLSPVISH